MFSSISQEPPGAGGLDSVDHYRYGLLNPLPECSPSYVTAEETNWNEACCLSVALCVISTIDLAPCLSQHVCFSPVYLSSKRVSHDGRTRKNAGPLKRHLLVQHPLYENCRFCIRAMWRKLEWQPCASHFIRPKPAATPQPCGRHQSMQKLPRWSREGNASIIPSLVPSYPLTTGPS